MDQHGANQLLGAINVIQGLYEHLERTLDEQYLPTHEKLKKVYELNRKIGEICAEHLPE